MNTEKKYTRQKFDELPFEVVVVDEKKNIFGSNSRRWVQVGPNKYLIQDDYRKYGLDIYNFEARPDDVYLVGYPRSGTTLHCEMVWQIGNNLDYEGAAKDVIDYRFPHIDLSIYRDLNDTRRLAEQNNVPEDLKNIANKYGKLFLQDIAARKGRRFIKSHLPLSLMPPHIFEVGAKVIYCARNPKDVMISLYNAYIFFNNPLEFTVDETFEYFKNDLAWLCPFFEHVKEAWARRNDENVLFLFYEDTIKDKRQAITRIADFLGKKLSAEQIKSLEEYLSIENFKTNKSVNCDHLQKLGVAKKDGQFIGNKKSGNWREVFDADVQNEINKWIENNLKGTNLRFPES